MMCFDERYFEMTATKRRKFSISFIAESTTYSVDLLTAIPENIIDHEFYLTDRVSDVLNIPIKPISHKRPNIFRCEVPASAILKYFKIKDDAKTTFRFNFPERPSRASIVLKLISILSGTSNAEIDPVNAILKLTINANDFKIAKTKIISIVKKIIYDEDSVKYFDPERL